MLSATLVDHAPVPASPPTPPPAPITRDAPDVTSLILRWQSTGDRSAFAALAEAVVPMIEAVAASELRRSGRPDAGLAAEAVSLVLDHLRRLHHPGVDDQPVSPFRPAPGCGSGAGLVYVRWLARRRAADLARSQRRRDRREPTFTHRFGDAGEPAATVTAATAVRPASRPLPPEESLRALADATHRLDAADRALAEALLAGESQVDIARRLGVSAGTVTRRRQRLLARMAATLRADGDGGDGTAPRLAAATAAAGPTLVSFELAMESRDALEFPVPRSVHSLYLHTRGHVVHVLARGGVRRPIDRRPGSMAFIAAGAAPAMISARASEPAAGVLVIVPPEVIADSCRDGGEDELRPLGDAVDFRDPSLADLIGRLRGHAGGGARQDQDGERRNGERRWAARQADDSPSLGILRRLLVILGAGFDGGDETASRLTPAEQCQLVEWIDGHLDRPLALEELAALFRLSVGHFARKVRNTFRMCPSRVVQQRRALAAIALMKDRDRSLAALAAQLGFSSQSHFTTMFRRHVGMTPAVFRHTVHGHPPAGGRRDISAVADFRAQRDSRPGVETACSHPAAAGAGRQA